MNPRRGRLQNATTAWPDQNNSQINEMLLQNIGESRGGGNSVAKVHCLRSHLHTSTLRAWYKNELAGVLLRRLSDAPRQLSYPTVTCLQHVTSAHMSRPSRMSSCLYPFLLKKKKTCKSDNGTWSDYRPGGNTTSRMV